MEEPDLILAELQRIRVVLSRFVVFVAVFAILVVLPTLAWLTWFTVQVALLPSALAEAIK